MIKKFTRGFGLIEVLVAIVIVAFGVAAVGKLQTYLITTSETSRARSEALTIAQEKLDLVRNTWNNSAYTVTTRIDQQNYQAEFLANLTSSGSIDKNFVSYQWSITQSSEPSEISVLVRWMQRDGKYDEVSLSTKLDFDGAISVAFNDFPANAGGFVDSPTGRAYIGDGVVGSNDTLVSSNSDGTKVYADKTTSGDTNIDLFLAVGDDVVLTLEEACSITTSGDDNLALTGNDTTTNYYRCTDFVEITGRVYFPQNYTTNYPSDIYVLASDAAYCSRYITSTGKDVEDFRDSGTIDISDFPLASDTNYRYFDYTCYLGGGWHGNVGLIVRGTSSGGKKNYFCVGDPNDLTNQPKEVARRAYRGMIWKKAKNSDGSYKIESGSNVPVKYETGDQDVIDRSLDALVGSTRYYSWGIADATVLTGGLLNQHDFLVGALSGNPSDPCGDLMGSSSQFDNNFGDFFCFNDPMSGAKGLAHSSGQLSNLDQYAFNSADYSYDDDCPYDPTNIPNFKYLLEGTITIQSTSDTDASYAFDLFDLATDQGENCRYTSGVSVSGSAYSKDFECDLYDAGILNNQEEFEKVGYEGYLLFNQDESLVRAFTDLGTGCPVDTDDSRWEEALTPVAIANTQIDITGFDHTLCFQTLALAARNVEAEGIVDVNSNIELAELIVNPENLTPLTYSISSASEGLSVALNGSVLTMNAQQIGVYTITYNVSGTDSEGGFVEVSGTITLTTASSNLLPVANAEDLARAIYINGSSNSITFSVQELLDNDNLGDGFAGFTIGAASLNGMSCSTSGIPCVISLEESGDYTASVAADSVTAPRMGWLEFEYTINDLSGDSSITTSRIPVLEVLTIPFNISFASNGAKISAVTAGSNTFCGAAATGKTTTTSCTSEPDISAPTSWSGSVTLQFSLGPKELICSVNSPDSSMITIGTNDNVSVYFSDLVNAPAMTTITMGETTCP